MNKSSWSGVMPAITTPFLADGTIDFGFFEKHIERFIASGCTGVVLGGSLGEAAALTSEEKARLVEKAVEVTNNRIPVILGVSALTAPEAVHMAKVAEQKGCRGLMLLPPYVYKGDWRETKHYFGTVLQSTKLSCMLYNNPIAYGTDTLPEQVKELADEFENLHAIKESSTDVRRLAAIRALIGNRLKLFVGVDDVIVEGIAMGAEGWIAGLVNAFPEESVELFQIASEKGPDAAMELYSWFLPLLRLDTVPKFVQLIKLVQQEVGLGSETVRSPRLPLNGAEREEALKVVHAALSSRKSLASV